MSPLPAPTLKSWLFFVFWYWTDQSWKLRGKLEDALELYRRAEAYVPDNTKLKERWIHFVIRVFLLKLESEQRHTWQTASFVCFPICFAVVILSCCESRLCPHYSCSFVRSLSVSSFSLPWLPFQLVVNSALTALIGSSSWNGRWRIIRTLYQHRNLHGRRRRRRRREIWKTGRLRMIQWVWMEKRMTTVY